MGCNTSQEKAAAVQDSADKNETDVTNEDNKNNVEAELIKSKSTDEKNGTIDDSTPMLNGEPLGKDEGKFKYISKSKILKFYLLLICVSALTA